MYLYILQYQLLITNLSPLTAMGMCLSSNEMYHCKVIVNFHKELFRTDFFTYAYIYPDENRDTWHKLAMLHFIDFTKPFTLEHEERVRDYILLELLEHACKIKYYTANDFRFFDFETKGATCCRITDMLVLQIKYKHAYHRLSMSKTTEETQSAEELKALLKNAILTKVQEFQRNVDRYSY
jgi:hypothetical protein